MALIKCPECKNSVSTKAKTCPHCGAPVKKKTSVVTWLLAILLFIVLGTFLGGIDRPPSVTIPDDEPVAASEPDKQQVQHTSQQVLPDTYRIGAKATVTGQYTVNVDIETNLPDSVVLAASLGLKNQNPEDIAIGTGFVKVPISGGKAHAVIDGRRGVMPSGSQLPAGDYDVKVAFHPLWPENKEFASRAKIKDSIRASDTIALAASGESAQSVKLRAEGQKWVMLNINYGHPWEPEFWKNKFGEIQQVEYRGSGNPRILKMYYIKSIDMTLMVNDLKKEIDTYREGLAHE